MSKSRVHLGPWDQANWTRRDFLRRSLYASAGSVAILTGLEACATDSGKTGASLTKRKGGHMTFGFVEPTTGLNPVLVRNGADQAASNICFDGLLLNNPDGTQIPGLAEAPPSVSKDGLTYTFKLRSGMKWSDGQPMTAEDVVFTWGLLYRPEYAELNAPARGELARIIDSVTATDPLTVVIKTKQVAASLLTTYGTIGVIPKHVLGNLNAKDLNNAPFNRAPSVVNGTFKFTRWDAGQQLVFERNPNYHRGPALLDNFIYKFVNSTQARTNALISGDVDLANADVTGLSQLQGASGLRVQTIDSRRGEMLVFQLDPHRAASRLFSDVRVRQALIYGIDRNAAMKGIYFNQASIADSFVLPNSWAYTSNLPKYPLDQRKAAQLLEAAGWTLGPSGIREKDGVPLSFKIAVHTGAPLEVAMATALQQDWKKIGVDAQPQVMGPAALQQAVINHDFDCFYALKGLWYDPDPSDVYASWNHSLVGGGNNNSGYSNPEADALMKQGIATLDRNSRKTIYDKLQTIIATDVPSPFIVWVKDVWGISSRLQGVNIGPYNTYGVRSETWPWLKDAWVTDGK